jgi:hypothetical protein
LDWEPSPTEGASEPHRSHDQDQDIDQNQEQEQEEPAAGKPLFGSLIGNNFELTSERRDFAESRNLIPELTHEKFGAFHASKQTRNADWDAAWKLWCLNENADHGNSTVKRRPCRSLAEMEAEEAARNAAAAAPEVAPVAPQQAAHVAPQPSEPDLYGAAKATKAAVAALTHIRQMTRRARASAAPVGLNGNHGPKP